ncbi:MAG: phage portal protein, partial [Blautia sp.]|nr:phage portal protein [Blautia sp.]
DMFRSINKHELILEPVLKELIRIIARLGKVIGVSVNPETEIVVDFDDSIIEDKQAERQSDRQDVSMGVMSLAEYRAKWYGETEEEAEKKLPEVNGVME